ncbi:hypothetical protein Ami103574_01735 [Aminipila butyrica]|uniref:Uncharacterized protein n=1 Tax=Aminipila butyrica TaxID=433296 RepID=A0A858BSQ5_9FIRM|nr:hypothetical protein [Aminipila butyrica]QIB68108.1 hypothetical protein Ami103574_01735 [Aminipila butyrica]
MYEPSDEFELANEKLHKMKETLNFDELQFQRIKSVINKAAIWSEEIGTMLLDFMKEFEEDEETKEELTFRYETAKQASLSADELWNQVNICADQELSKETLLIILKGFIEYYEVLANHLNDGEDTEILTNLRKTLMDIKELK